MLAGRAAADRGLGIEIAATSRRRERFFSALDAHPRPMLLVDSSGLVAANDAACVQFGFSEAALIDLGLAGVTDRVHEWEARLEPLLDGRELAVSWVDLVKRVGGTQGAHVRATGLEAGGAKHPEMIAILEVGVVIDEPHRRNEGHRARQRYERLVDSAQEGIWEVDIDGCTVFANRRMAEILGCEVGDLVGRPMLDFFDPELRPAVEAQLAVLKEGRADRFDARCRRADGSSVWLMASATPLFDEDGNYGGAAATAVDVTERREQEHALRSAEELLRRTFDSAPIGTALVGIDGRWNHVNDAACRMLGREREELEGLTFQEVTYPDDLHDDLGLIEETLAGTRDGYSMEKRYLRPNGQVVWAALTVGLVRDDRGDPLFFVAQMEDISDRRRIEADLERARARTQRVLDRAAVAMAILDEEMRVSECNDEFRRLFGTDVDASTLLSDRLEENSAMRFGELLRLCRAGTAAADLEMSDATVVHALVTRVDENADRGWIVQALDVSAERAERQRLAELADRDPLTGLLNRRGLHSAVEDQAPGQALSILYIDLDGFKAMNDTFGHDEGDRQLVGVAQAVTTSTRTDVDLVARVGGDEFVVVLPGGTAHQALVVADRLLVAISSLLTESGHPGAGASIGTATGYVRDLDDLVDRADEALRRAKAEGKGRVACAPSPVDRHGP